MREFEIEFSISTHTSITVKPDYSEYCLNLIDTVDIEPSSVCPSCNVKIVTKKLSSEKAAKIAVEFEMSFTDAEKLTNPLLLNLKITNKIHPSATEPTATFTKAVEQSVRMWAP